MRLKSLEKSEKVLAVMLFGSAARKDKDTCSDKDIFVLCKDMSLSELGKVKQDFIVPTIGEEASICAYRYNDVVRMADKGSLFLWHLKLEGRMIFSKDKVLEGIIGRLKKYDSYKEDLNCYTDLLTDVENSLKKWGVLCEFDLSLLFTISRNVCMLLCYYRGQPRFGRFDVYYTARSIFGDEFPMPEELYRELCSWKMWYERGVKSDRDSCNKREHIFMVRKVNKLVEFAQQDCLWKSFCPS